MISLTSEYALRAMIYLAQHAAEWPISGKEIAEGAGVPPKYLSTILSSLVHAGVLESTRGKRGGFRMVRSPKATPLFEILAPFENFERRRCPFGNQRCSDDDPCVAHAEWKKVVTSMHQFLKKTMVVDVAKKLRDGDNLSIEIGKR